MKRFILLLLLLALACPIPAQADASYMQFLANGDFAAVHAVFTGEMQAALSVGALAQAVNSLGKIESFDPPEISQNGGYDIADYPVHQGGGLFTYRIVTDADGAIAGLNIRPAAVPESAPPADVRTETVYLRPGEADETEAILTLPEGDGPFPAVILVHGSGPNDRDESVSGMKVFRDIAGALARQGVASLRYDKYTYAHADKITDAAAFTMMDEYLPDVTAALALLEGDARIGGIFYLGHSQGGMLMPRIVTLLGESRFAGAIAVAGTPLHMYQVQYHQNRMLLEDMSGMEKLLGQMTVDAEMQKLDAIAGWSDEERKANTLFGVSAYYQWDDMQHDAGALASQLQIPLLMLQGDADWQVPPQHGVELWGEVCPQADIVLLENITHMLNRVDEATGTAADYHGSVDAAVTDALAAWILSNRD